MKRSPEIADTFDIENFIAVGCLRLKKPKLFISNDVWEPCDTWQLVPLYSQCENGEAEGIYKRATQGLLRDTAIADDDIVAIGFLLEASWIRLQFRTDDEQGQVRVYVLPEDFGRKLISRDDSVLKKALSTLLSHLDTSRATWAGTWSKEDPIRDINFITGGNDSMAGDDASLSEIFNSLPSPTPDASIVKDKRARSAMRRILRGGIEGMKTTMLPYQRRSAAMMLQQEVQPHQLLDPRLLAAKDHNNRPWYFDPAEGVCLRDPRFYDAPSGGICAETMGLGKTLICLALILATKEHFSHIPPEHSVDTVPVRPNIGSLFQMSAAAITRTGTPWRKYFADLRARNLDYTKCVDGINATVGYYTIPPPVLNIGCRMSTRSLPPPPRIVYLSRTSLVVVPRNLVRQWEHEISKHTTGLKVLVMTDAKQILPPAKELLEYDIVLFSRQRFEAESRDGTDSLGRRTKSSPIKVTGCARAVDARAVDRFDANNLYRSPLREILFKRLITDEGHIMGNASSSIKNNAAIVVDFLQLASKWVVSGTPTPGLFGVDSALDLGSDFGSVSSRGSSILDTGSVEKGDKSIPSPPVSDSGGDRLSKHEQERNDLEKLGNIAAVYLKAQPWSGNDKLWSQYVMQPKHNKKSRGTPRCLRATLEGMIIRHLPSDVEREVQLPPLYKKTVYLEGSEQDKISLNLFSMMINANAVTSERKDKDYMFHPTQRGALLELVSNLRMASFFWSGFSYSAVKSTLLHVEKFLAKLSTYQQGSLCVSDSDLRLLEKALECGNDAVSNTIWSCSSSSHDMPIYLKNCLTPKAQTKCSLDGHGGSPTLFGTTLLVDLQKKLNGPLNDKELMKSLQHVGLAIPDTKIRNRGTQSNSHGVGAAKVKKLMDETLKSLDCGESPGLLSPPRGKNQLLPRKPASPKKTQSEGKRGKVLGKAAVPEENDWVTPSSANGKSANHEHPGTDMRANDSTNFPPHQYRAPNGSFGKATLLATASAKLSYLLDQVLLYQAEEKIIIFYENDSVAYYISQALDCVGVPNLIYAKTLTTDRRSQYLITFNASPQFRCLLMDISQAAFGLDITSASRVYFVNPVVSKQVEAQAVKRAHRIGQTRPVYVETLVLKSSIEEVIVQRREEMSGEEQKRCKTLLDDVHMYDWIKNVGFVPLPPSEPGRSKVDAMARVQTRKNVFEGRGVHDPALHHPDAGLVMDRPLSTEPSTAAPRPQKRKRRAVTFAELTPDEDEHREMNIAKRPRPLGGSVGQSVDMPVRHTCEASAGGSLAPEGATSSCASATMQVRKSIFGP